ncbi:hypothetical protein K469DRAFT_686892 [Zopfia rhizophila CBS 207.26]|uniref:Uncharacterized protein n=1 Tax=Zopfia rhizophila CBS 207.26 TaxID=1314779 RepID=A0A6A6E6V4_9PEZI|nr:hypothetical protein K469DRAFT_686892 [Zopfia rhizophila CBS 207.26]
MPGSGLCRHAQNDAFKVYSFIVGYSMMDIPGFSDNDSLAGSERYVQGVELAVGLRHGRRGKNEPRECEILRPVKYFVGRTSVLAEMETYFCSPRHETELQKFLVLSGIVGNCIQIDVSSKGSVNESFTVVASTIKTNLSLNNMQYGTEPDTLPVQFVKEWLSQRQTRWLMTFNNYDNPAEVDVDWLIPWRNIGDIIIMLSQWDTQLNRATTVVEYVGYPPLGLEPAGAFMFRTRDASLQKYSIRIK